MYVTLEYHTTNTDASKRLWSAFSKRYTTVPARSKVGRLKRWARRCRHGHPDRDALQPVRGLALQQCYLRDFLPPLRYHRHRCQSGRAYIEGTASKYQEIFVGGARNAGEHSQISGLCPRGCAVGLRGGSVFLPQRG
jgi:hypothetical protein